MFRNRRDRRGRVIEGEGCLAADLVRLADANARAALTRCGDLITRNEQLQNRMVEVEGALHSVETKLAEAIGRLEVMRTEQSAAVRVRTALYRKVKARERAEKRAAKKETK
jgi:hypothetical protein